ncbi:MAG: DMT family transporter, partial [Betaproteobacteria bacterium]|nr:DMT family transporter [Betaproteobacteria bacterium]
AGLALVEASRAALIVPTNPAFTALFAAVFLKERLGPVRALGVGLSVVVGADPGRGLSAGAAGRRGAGGRGPVPHQQAALAPRGARRARRPRAWRAWRRARPPASLRRSDGHFFLPWV